MLNSINLNFSLV